MTDFLNLQANGTPEEVVYYTPLRSIGKSVNRLLAKLTTSQRLLISVCFTSNYDIFHRIWSIMLCLYLITRSACIRRYKKRFRQKENLIFWHWRCKYIHRPSLARPADGFSRFGAPGFGFGTSDPG